MFQLLQGDFLALGIHLNHFNLAILQELDQAISANVQLTLGFAEGDGVHVVSFLE